MEDSKIVKLFVLAIVGVVICGIALSMKPWFIVKPGFTAIKLRLGSPVGVLKQPGFYTKTPLDKIIYIDNRICRTAIETRSLSKDLQTVDIGAVLNYRVEDGYNIYKTIGDNFEGTIINPFVQESLKAVVAKFTAEDLIQQRHTACEWVNNELKDRLAKHYITLVDFNFIHLDFTHDFIHAVEQKQIAEQASKTVRNLTEKVKEEAGQARLLADAKAYAFIAQSKAESEATKIRADAEAYSLKTKRESITPDLILLKKAEGFIMAIEKWDGCLPKVVNTGASMMEFEV